MKYAKLGSTGALVSKLAFGAMNFGEGQGIFGFPYKVDQAGAKEMVAKAIDAGVTLFDTANIYAAGRSEEMLGRALGSWREDIVLATKVGNRMSDKLVDAGLSRRHILASARASLDRLGTDRIDLFQLHIPDPLTPLEETTRALDDLVRRGLVHYLGFSNLPAWQAALALGNQRDKNYAPFVSTQVYYSLLGRDIEHEIVPLAQHAGLGILVWSPLAGGFLSGKYTRENPGGGGGRRAIFDFPPIDRELAYKVVDRLWEIAKAQDASPAQVALAWVISKPFVTSVIVGASKMGQLEENLAAVDVNLTREQLEDLDKLTAPPLLYPNWMAAAEGPSDEVAAAALRGEWPQGR